MRILVVMVALFLAGCSPREARPDEQKGVADSITYIQDHRTGICFALIASPSANSGWTVMSIATVPCDAAAKANSTFTEAPK